MDATVDDARDVAVVEPSEAMPAVDMSVSSNVNLDASALPALEHKEFDAAAFDKFTQFNNLIQSTTVDGSSDFVFMLVSQTGVPVLLQDEQELVSAPVGQGSSPQEAMMSFNDQVSGHTIVFESSPGVIAEVPVPADLLSWAQQLNSSQMVPGKDREFVFAS